MNNTELKIFLDEKVDFFNRLAFIQNDPICIPHRFSKKQDIEIAGFFAAIFAWGIRKTIINKSTDLLNRMDNCPHDFILNHSDKDLKGLLGFKHRTFNDIDLLFLVNVFKQHYKKYDSLEDAFFLSNVTLSLSKGSMGLRQALPDKNKIQEQRLENFYNYIFSHDHLRRSEKHISTPAKNSACKRINMYLRWMVRQDNQGVDFGIWTRLNPRDLMIPLDVHVCRVAHELGLMDNQKSNWKETVMLTEKLRQYDAADPVKYDFALFGMGVAGK